MLIPVKSVTPPPRLSTVCHPRRGMLAETRSEVIRTPQVMSLQMIDTRKSALADSATKMLISGRLHGEVWRAPIGGKFLGLGGSGVRGKSGGEE